MGIFSSWLRGFETALTADVINVFNVARTAVAAVPFLPTNLKTDATNILNDAQADLTGLESLAGSLVGGAVADCVDDVTTLLVNTANAVTNSTTPAQFSLAEKTVLQQAWTAAKAQGDTLMVQFMAGIDPTKPSVAPTPTPTPTPSPIALPE